MAPRWRTDGIIVELDTRSNDATKWFAVSIVPDGPITGLWSLYRTEPNGGGEWHCGSLVFTMETSRVDAFIEALRSSKKVGEP